MHSTLKRQLKKLGIQQAHVPAEEIWLDLIEQVNSTYEAADQDRYILERSLEISSSEMQELYRKQKASYETRLHSILNALPDVLFFMTEEGKCLDVMSGNRRLRERYQEIAIGNTARDVFPESADLFESAIRRALDSRDMVVLEYDLEIDTDRHYFEGRIMPAEYEYEGQRTVVFIAIDVTKRYKSEIQSHLISTVFENSKDGMLIVDASFNLVMVNTAFCLLFDETTDSIEQALPEIRGRILNNENGAEIARSIYDEGHWVGEISNYTEAGEINPLWLSINTVKDHKGKIINYVMMLSDVSEIKRSQEELEHVATHDALTNLPNRILFQDRLEQAIQRAERNSKLGGLFFLDLDRFKNINDNLGHQVGDDLLVQVTQRLMKICRKTDTLARLGGDEFTLIVENIDNVNELAQIANKILKLFAEPFNLSSYNLDISSSIGISVFPQDSHEPGELIRHADTAMYSAKEQGRNNYKFYTHELTSNAFEYFALEIALRNSISRNQLELMYQPQYDMQSGSIIGVEALLRWDHPKMGHVAPSRFIPIAETTGQIEPIGEWVITEAARQCRRWDKAGLPAFIVSLNISRKQLIKPDLAERVRAILEEEGVSGSRLEFEITESSILDQRDVVYENLKALKDMGISMAIDDFGTGYSSLVNLKQFPLSRLKIDQSFVRDVTRDINDEAIIKATIALGKSLQLEIIAEGVETMEQRDFLVNEGCEQAQGYLFSKPVSAKQIPPLFDTRKQAIK